jgi:hypothetical protein
VPADGDIEVLKRGLQDALELRATEGADWAVKDEIDLVERQQRAIDDLRTARQTLTVELSGVRQLKAEVLAEVAVDRVVSYFRKATQPTATAEQTASALYKMVEFLEDHLECGEVGLPDALSVPRSDIKALKRFANVPQHDLRHASTGDAAGPPTSEVLENIEAGRRIVQAFIERRYRQRLESVGLDE